jgi:hypothetical protein
MTNEERQRAIEWMKGRPVMMAGAKRMYDLAVEALEAYVPDMNDGNMISRQAAIDIERNATVDTNPSHFEAHQKFTQFMDDAEISSFGRWQWSNGFNTALTAVGIDLKKLPSAQPERTCVNCGRTANNGGWYADGRTRCPIEEHYALPKDGYCHLWEKRNVTDDDYPERREE